MQTHLPCNMYVSQRTKCVMLSTAGGYKEAYPYLSFFVTDAQPNDAIEGQTQLLALSGVAHDGAVDEGRGLLYAGDDIRIKSYSWWNPETNARRDDLIPTHTMNSKSFGGPIGLLSNGRVARAGTGKVAIWNIDDLPIHQRVDKGAKKSTPPKLIGKSIADKYGDFDTWRKDPDEIELSSGSKPSSVIKLSETDLKISTWHPHPTSAGTMLISTDTESCQQFYCRAIDLETSGQCTSRFLGHGGEIDQFSTSKGDKHVFVTACTDGHARLYDVRHPLPQITIRAGDWADGCSAAVICHPDSIPCAFANSARRSTD